MVLILNHKHTVTCLGCKGMKQYPNGFRKGLCFFCFPKSIDDREADIEITDIIKMLFTRNTFLKCDNQIINFLKSELETNHFPKLTRTIPKGYQLNIENEKYSDYNSAGELIGGTWGARIMIFEPNARNPGTDIPIATFNVDRNFNITL
jgi:hypothetical protein